ncbi:ABC transporter ATP-binding protein [Raoultibacter phocaeensis]|uniref:ABC transporter ATP-binding protein n=1 Tax=Raoultibacter phocaeensis TaxID=2479841 RepID=UPI0011191B2B|nr:ABC transporter ATP-binding protein [Raoultibacter phocaeensis]
MTPMLTRLLMMDRVRLSFKQKLVLNDLTFEIRRGETFGFLGPSGAGKTTTIKLLTRQLSKDSGTIELFSRPIENAHDADYERIGILSDTSSLYERMSIEDNLKFYASIRGMSDASIPGLLERVRLYDDRKTLIKKCSKGMRQRATLLAALIHDPELLFLDEPTSGLDPAARLEVHRMLKDLHDRGTTIFLTTHDMSEAEALCDRVGILDNGHLVACDTPMELKMRFAENRIMMVMDDAVAIETTKDAAGAAIIAEALESGKVLSIHSEEPSLNDVFLRLTGKEFE